MQSNNDEVDSLSKVGQFSPLTFPNAFTFQGFDDDLEQIFGVACRRGSENTSEVKSKKISRFFL
jgi:hypothetical protein